MKNIVLIGFMGAGKTSIGIKLSYALKTPMEDTDKLIVKQQNRSIPEIFATDGEEAFRQMETNLLRELIEKKKTSKQGLILSVGGGLPLREENQKLLKELGMVVYLKAKPETIYERVKDDTNRPLLQCEDPYKKICDLMQEREAKYEAAATHIIQVDGKDFKAVVDEIKKLK